MTALRLISFSTHAALELVLGLALIVAPFVLGFSAAGIVVAVAIGALTAGLALSAATSEGTTIPISAHWTFDQALALGLLGSAAVIAIAGDKVAAITFAVAALVQLALNVTTRYSAPG
jgi:hypothetical protein